MSRSHKFGPPTQYPRNPLSRPRMTQTQVPPSPHVKPLQLPPSQKGGSFGPPSTRMMMSELACAGAPLLQAAPSNKSDT
jgi:hypothetical protein